MKTPIRREVSDAMKSIWQTASRNHSFSLRIQPSDEYFVHKHNIRRLQRCRYRATKADGVEQQERDPSQFDEALAVSREKQARTPWHFDGSAEPPIHRQRSAGAMTKGDKDNLALIHTWG